MKTNTWKAPLNTPGIFLALVVLLPACRLVSPGAPEPPLPTIVQVSPTASPRSASTATATQPAPTPTPLSGHSAGDELVENQSEAQSQSTGRIETPTLTVEDTETATSVPTTVAPPTQSPPAPLPTATPAVAQLPSLDSISLNLIPIASGFNKPVFLTHAGDGTGRHFVVEQAGRILILQDGVVNPTPFLDIVSIVGSDANEQGLLSVAFHPDYLSNGSFFLNYTDRQGDTVVARYNVSDNPDVADPTNAKVLLTIGQPYGNHNGGQIAFGPDGYLYIGMGDGGAANDPQNRAQDLGTLLGKILRIDIDNAEPYGVPQTNPFTGNEGIRPEIWSFGWRNPWRFSFDRSTGDMYIADVGQNQYEEVNVEWGGTPGGQNYGWRLLEGLHCFNPSDCDPAALGVILPVVEYDHSLGCSVTGGYVYRGTQFPALDGTYFYGDYCSGIIWGIRREADGTWFRTELLRSSQTISSFGQDETGEIYLVDHKGSVFQVGN